MLVLRMWHCVMSSRRERGQSLAGSKEMALPLLRKMNETVFKETGTKLGHPLPCVWCHPKQPSAEVKSMARIALVKRLGKGVEGWAHANTISDCCCPRRAESGGGVSFSYLMPSPL